MMKPNAKTTRTRRYLLGGLIVLSVCSLVPILDWVRALVDEYTARNFLESKMHYRNSSGQHSILNLAEGYVDIPQWSEDLGELGPGFAFPLSAFTDETVDQLMLIPDLSYIKIYKSRAPATIELDSAAELAKLDVPASNQKLLEIDTKFPTLRIEAGPYK